jgi:Zn-dependent protease
LPLVDFSVLPLLFVVLAVSLTVHEAAHAWSADLLGDPTPLRAGRVSLSPPVHLGLIGALIFPFVSFVSGFPFFGWSRPTPIQTSELGRRWRSKVALIAAAGPLANLGLALGAALLLRVGSAVSSSGLDSVSLSFLVRIIDINLLLALVNLLPIPPLDVGNALATVLPDPAGALLRQLRPFGPVLLYVLMLSGALSASILPIRSSLRSALLLS